MKKFYTKKLIAFVLALAMVLTGGYATTLTGTVAKAAAKKATLKLNPAKLSLSHLRFGFGGYIEGMGFDKLFGGSRSFIGSVSFHGEYAFEHGEENALLYLLLILAYLFGHIVHKVRAGSNAAAEGAFCPTIHSGGYYKALFKGGGAA